MCCCCDPWAQAAKTLLELDHRRLYDLSRLRKAVEELNATGLYGDEITCQDVIEIPPPSGVLAQVHVLNEARRLFVLEDQLFGSHRPIPHAVEE